MPSGDVEKSWRNFYAEDGTLITSYEWQLEAPPFFREAGEGQLSLGLNSEQ